REELPSTEGILGKDDSGHGLIVQVTGADPVRGLCCRCGSLGTTSGALRLPRKFLKTVQQGARPGSFAVAPTATLPKEGIFMGAAHAEGRHPQGSQCRRSAPLDRGAGSSQRPLPGWFEAVDGSEPQASCLISNHPRWASAQHPVLN